MNDRYVLHGPDPNSSGGILWCLGQFDRPFSPEKPILGSVRSRPMKQHAGRPDVELHGRRTARPAVTRSHRVAIVGAGVSGLMCARTLVDHGLEVVVFDKGSRPGGRLATRKVGVWEYDHGAQYFTVQDPRFERWVESWLEDSVVAEWKGRLVSVEGHRRRQTSRGTRRYVGVPEMNSVAAHLARELSIRSRVQIHSIMRKGRKWYLKHESAEEGPYDVVVVAVPAPQAVPLLRAAPRLQSEVKRIRMSGCWTVMLAFPSPLGVDFDGAFVNQGPLSWIARNGCKPGRRGETWVLHASSAWTQRHLESDPEPMAAPLIEAFATIAQVEFPEPIDLRVHRWRFASPEATLPAPCMFDERLGLAVCGDWCGGPKVEGAFLSGSAAAGRVLGWRRGSHGD